MQSVHQFVPSYVGRAAIGTHTHQVRLALEAMGVHSEIYAGDWRDVPDHVHHWDTYRPDATGSTWVLYQLSTGHGMAEMLAASPDPLIVNYHNITPEPFLRPWEPLVAPELRAGRAQMADLAARTTLGIAVSEYNEGELRAAGYRHTTTVPVLVDYEALAAEEDHGATARLQELKGRGGADWLFVGRITPNKAQHRLVQALAVYRRLYDPLARLWLVGGCSSHRYQTTIEDLCAELGLTDAVTLTGSVPQAQLVSHYRSADVFVCLSEHEGFGVPLVEALGHGLPVVALDSSGVTSTLGGAGLLLPQPLPSHRGHGRAVSVAADTGVRQPAPAVVAAAVARLVTDLDLRDAIAERGRARAAHFALDVTRPLFQSVMASVLGA